MVTYRAVMMGFGNVGGAVAIASVAADLLLEASPTSVRTGEPGLVHIRAALSGGMHVVTANKGPLDDEGWDSAAKINILDNSVMGGDLRLDDVHGEGISAITTAHLTQARRQGGALKLLASVRRGPCGLHLTV